MVPQTNAPDFIIYRSSAGSGKTYTLAREYILLALQHPRYFRHILAVTFTNKATAEMKDRIIKSLYSLGKGEGKGLRAEIAAEAGISDRQLSEQAMQCLYAILHDYSHFHVSTIDKFFQRVLRAFAREVGIQGGGTLELDQERVLNEVIDRMLTEVGDNQQLTEWIVRFAEDKLLLGKAWDVRKDVQSLGRELFKERFKEVAPLWQEVTGEENRLPRLLRSMQELMAVFENRLGGFVAKFEETLALHELTVDDFKSKGNGPAGLFAKFTKKEYELSPAREAAAGNIDAWIVKTSPKMFQLEKALHGGILQAYDGMVGYYKRQITDYNTAARVMRQLYAFGIMDDLTRKLADFRDEEEVMLISDAPDFLHRIIGNNDTPWIYEKAATFYQHYLIDEFQDTSGFQWKNFRPLIENSLSQGYKNMVVGDVKQSIYRWRGGDSGLLLDQVAGDVGPEAVRYEQLQSNWRSHAHLIAFNNALFELAPELLATMLEKEAGELENAAVRNAVEGELRRFRRSYHQASQSQGNEAKAGGLIRLQWLEKANNTDEEADDDAMGWEDRAIEAVISTIEQLQAGYLLKDICVLVRKAEEGRRVARALLEKKAASDGRFRYDVISPESLYLSASPAIKLLLAAFNSLYRPSNNLYQAQLAYEYRCLLAGEGPAPDLPALFMLADGRYGKERLEALLPGDFVREGPVLLRLPLMELAVRLINIFQLTNHPGEFSYLLGFQDTLLEYSKNNRGDVGAFLQWWEETGARRSVQVPDDQDAIRIMTVHKAKGLEFKAVIVPFCSWSFDHQLEEILWCKAPDIAPFNQMPVYPVRYSSKLAETWFAKEYYKEKLQIYLDNLNLLYVALTRAEEALYIYGPLPDFKKNGYSITRVSDLLYKLFMDGESGSSPLSPSPEIDAATHVISIGGLPAYDVDKSENTTIAVSLSRYFSSGRKHRLSVRQQGGAPGSRMKEEKLSSRHRGTVYHRLLSCIKKAEDLDRVLAEQLPQERLEADERLALSSRLRELFALPQMQEWYGPGWEVKTEASVLHKQGDVRRVDRVMLRNNEAVLIEFKTGRETDGHQKQAKDYVNLLTDMGYSMVSGYLVYIDELIIRQVT